LAWWRRHLAYRSYLACRSHGLIVADPPQDVLQPQASGGPEDGIDRPK
jgi:hypothetical protein